MIQYLAQRLQVPATDKGRTLMPELEKMVTDSMLEVFNGPNGLIAKATSLIDKYYTTEEIEALNQFYSSPIGKKSVAVAAQMSVDMMAIGSELALDAVPDITIKLFALLKEKGLLADRPNPLPVHMPEPIYPVESSARREHGTLALRVLVNRHGKIDKVTVNRSSGHQRLDQAGIAAVTNWKFLPAVKRGMPVDAWIDISMQFKVFQTDDTTAGSVTIS